MTVGLRYRPEIDGLRALAVVPVILFHAGVTAFSGGFVGVDVFYVISGYLITALILDEVDAGKFSARAFYERRARRLLPALYAVLLVCAAYLFVQPPFAARDLAQSIGATTLFSENILLVLERTPYFGIAAEFKPLLHAWSLGVEEQFYLLYPLILLTLLRHAPRKLDWILPVLLTASLVMAGTASRSVSFYMLPARAWELLSGALAARWLRAGHSLPGVAAEAAGASGVALIVGAVIGFDGTGRLSILASVIATLGAVLVIVGASGTTQVGRALSARGLVAIGLASYSAYLWHQPLLAILRAEAIFWSENRVAIVAVALTAVLAAASYRFVENPVRRGRMGKAFLPAVLLVSAALLGIAYAGHRSTGFEALKLARIEPADRALYVSHETELARRQRLLADFHEWERARGGGPHAVEVIGDSMADDLGMALWTAGLDVRVSPLDGACWKAVLSDGAACGMSFENVMATARTSEVVILASDFIRERSAASALALAARLQEGGNRVRILDTLRFRHVASLAYQYIARRPRERPFPDLLYRALDGRTADTNRALRASRAIALEKYGQFCDDATQTCELLSPEGKPYLYDEMHFTVEGLKELGRRLAPRVGARPT